MKKNICLILLISIVFISCNSSPESGTSSAALSKDSVLAIAKAAYVYGMPLALVDISKKKTTNVEAPINNLAAPVNQFFYFTEFPDAKQTLVVRPNADTYYDVAFLDLTKEPIVLTIPNTHGRYFLMPMLDAFTNIFASPGTRTGITKGETLLITGPEWSGKIDSGMTQLKSPTNTVWIIGRYQVNSNEDGKKVILPLEKATTLVPLSAFGKPYTAPKGMVIPGLSKEAPNKQLMALSVDSFFNYLNQLLITNPAPDRDSNALAKFAKIGVGPGTKFGITSFDTATQSALKELPKMIFNEMERIISSGAVKPVNGWSLAYKGFGNYGTDYDLRGLVSYFGLGANIPEDAVYPTSTKDVDGNPYNGANKYLLHFDKGQTPPVNAFWSVTMYNNEGYFIENPINRYAIGSRNPLKFNADSSLDLYIQNVSPGKGKESNWLPAPTGDFNLCLRMYWPKEVFLSGNWTPAGVSKVK